MDRKLKVLVIGDCVVPTGFSNVIKNIFFHLVDDIDVFALGINYRGDPHNWPFPIFPASLAGDIYGLNRLQDFTLDQPDIIFVLNDVWVTDKYLAAFKQVFKEKMPKIVVYFPVDAEEHDSDWYKNFDIVDVAVTYTEYAKKVVLKAAPELESKLRIISHGVDTETYFPIERAEARKHLFGNRTDDSFIFLSVARNQPRKKLDILMEGFKLFSENKPKNARLYMHCGVRDMGIDIPKLAVRLGIDNRLILTNLVVGVQTIPESRLNLIYNSCNVGVNTGLGEGFGLPSVEHAVTGAPQIVPDHSACRELFSDCGLLVPAKVSWTFDHIMTVGKLITPEDLAVAMESLYTNEDLYNDLSLKALKKFTTPEFSWKEISKIWLKIFEEIK